jgi:PhoH-like ATPase
MKQQRTFVIDTNVILNDYDAPFRIAKHHNVIIPLVVIRELDGKKNNKKVSGSVAMNARRFHARLKEELLKVTPTKEPLLKASLSLNLYIETRTFENALNIADKQSITNDILILSIAKHYTTKISTKLLTNDNNMLIQSYAHGVKAEGVDQHKASTHFTGVSEIIFGRKMVQQFHEGTDILLTSKKFPDLYPNQVVIIKMKRVKTSIGFALFRGYDKPLKKITQGTRNIRKIEARNKEQEWLMAMGELLGVSDEEKSIDLLTIEGPAGSGKTLLAVAKAIKLAEDNNVTVTLTKPLSVMGNQETGFLPGNLTEKMRPFMRSYLDILDKLDYVDMNMYFGSAPNDYMNNKDEWDHTKNDNKCGVDFDVLSHIRGRNMNGIIIVDEAQNLTRHELKSLVTRADEGAKIILIADIGQIDTPHLDKWNNGFIYVSEKMKQFEFTAHIALRKCERSRLAKAAGENL